MWAKLAPLPPSIARAMGVECETLATVEAESLSGLYVAVGVGDSGGNYFEKTLLMMGWVVGAALAMGVGLPN